jgi:hypothetical protein
MRAPRVLTFSVKVPLGRLDPSDIEIDDPQVSSLHCVVGAANDIVRLCDLDSVSGTYANEERVHAAELETRNAAGEEFSRDRLLAVVVSHSGAAAHHLAEAIHASVVGFSETDGPEDDLTVVISEGRVSLCICSPWASC